MCYNSNREVRAAVLLQPFFMWFCLSTGKRTMQLDGVEGLKAAKSGGMASKKRCVNFAYICVVRRLNFRDAITQAHSNKRRLRKNRCLAGFFGKCYKKVSKIQEPCEIRARVRKKGTKIGKIEKSSFEKRQNRLD